MPRNYVARPKLWTEASVNKAIQEVGNGASVKCTAIKYHLSVSMLRKRWLAHSGEVCLGKRGGKTRIPMQTEEKLAFYIRRMAECGFGPTQTELCEIVSDYLVANEMDNLFKNHKPGYDWVQNFMKRHKLSLKKASLMQIPSPSMSTPSFLVPSTSTTSSEQTPDSTKTLPQLMKMINRYAPDGMKYIFSLVPKENETTFESVIRSCGCPSTTASQPVKRHRVLMHGSVLTNEELKKQEKEKLPPPKVVMSVNLSAKWENEVNAENVTNHQERERNGGDNVPRTRQKKRQTKHSEGSASLKNEKEERRFKENVKINEAFITAKIEKSEKELKEEPLTFSSEDAKIKSVPGKDNNLTRKRKRDERKGKEIKSKKKNDSPVIPPLKYDTLGVGPQPVPFTGKKYIGCHVSAAGGVWMCFENGLKSNADSIAMFLRNQRSWNAKPLDDNSIKKWNEAMKDFPRHLILPHGSFLMNLGSPKPEMLEKSRRLFVEELQRCEKLGIPHFNFHPGSTLGEISRTECCKRVAESINIAHRETSDVICVIENMSKQGFTLGGDFHEIRLIIEGVENKTRVGVCIDTCHAHAAGYDLASEDGFNEMVNDFAKIIGWQFLRGLHINDSKGEVGNHKDRHENIGKGFIGREGFRRVMNYPRFNDIPLILETPFVNEETYGKEIKLLQKFIV